MKQHLKDAKHARTKAAKRERLNPKPQKHWAFPAGITLLLFSLVYAATNFGSVNTTKHSPQATQIPLVTPANAGAHESALLTNANYTPNQSFQDNFSHSSNVPAVVKNISSATTSRTYQYNNREQLVSMTEDAVTTTYL